MSAPRPPRLAARLLEWRLHPDERDELVGDLDEQFLARVPRHGRRAARWWYWRQALALTWGFAVRRRDVISTTHERTRGRWAADNAITDLRHAWRSLRHAPSFAVVAVLTLTFGIGLSTAVFSLVNGILLRPLPYPHPDRLVRLAEYRPKEPVPATGGELSDTAVGLWIARHQTLDAISPYSTGGHTVVTPSGPANLGVAEVGGSFFDILATQPAAGRLLQPTDMEPGADPVAVISDRLWRTAFGGRSDALGRTVDVEGTSRVVVGIAARSFVFPDTDTDIWVPGAWRWPKPGMRRNFAMRVTTIARLRAGATIEDANTEGAAIARAIATADPAFDEGTVEITRIRARRLLDDVVATVRPALLTLGAGMALVLVAACVNLANLLLARHTARQRDLAVRLALGAGRWRIARPVLFEQLLLGGAGGMGGAVLAWWILRAVPLFAPADLPRLHDIHFDLASLAFTSIAALVTAVVVGLLPVWQMPATDVRELVASGRVRVGAATRSADGLRSILVVGQVALAVVLLVGALLIGRSLFALLRVNPGYQPTGVLTFQLSLPEGIWRQKGRETALFEGLLDRFRQHPSVISAAFTGSLPLHQVGSRGSINPEGHPPPVDRLSQPMAIWFGSTTDYLRTVGTRILRGRGFDARDTMDALKVIIIDETVEKLAFQNEDPLGRRLHGPGNQFWTIVGVAEAVRMGSLGEAPQPMIYYHAPQLSELLAYGMVGNGFALRTKGDPIDLLPFVRDEVHAADPTIPVFNAQRLSDALSTSVAQPRFFALVVALFAALALSTALLGIYGVLAYAVERRRLEFGVRRALGATERHVMGLVMRRGFTLAAIGIVLGLAGAAVGTRFIRALLFGVTPADPLSYVGSALIALAVVLAASWQPVRRALRIDPARALRVD